MIKKKTVLHPDDLAQQATRDSSSNGGSPQHQKDANKVSSYKNETKVVTESESPARVEADFKFIHLPPYLNKESAKNLKQYKYAGGDLGLVYIYFYNPVSKWLVERIPDYIAPNSITLLGFMFTLGPFLYAFTFFGTKFESEVPVISHMTPNFFYMSAFSYLVYRMLDEMDGKQARRTGNSSPLGLIFDHGCDAFSIGFQCAFMTKMIQNGDSIYTVLFIQGSLWIFHFCTLEEYYAGGLWLQVGNGITDGSVVVIAIQILTGVMGYDWWKSTVALPAGSLFQGSPELDPQQLVLAVMYIFLPLTIVTNWKNLYIEWSLTDEEKNSPDKPYGEKLTFKNLMVQKISYAYTMLITTSLAYIGEKPFMHNPTPKGELSTLFLMIVLQNFLMQHLTCYMMVCHCTKQIYSPLNNRLNNFVMFCTTAVVTLSQVAPKVFNDHIDIKKFLIMMLIVVFICQWFYILNIVKEMAQALKINVFRVKEKSAKDKSE